MRLVNELKGNAADYVVLTGDGKTDAEVLKALCIRYNGKEIIWYPKLPMKEPRRAGLSIFKAIKIYPGKYNLNKFLVLIDREHFIEKMKGRRKAIKKKDERELIEDYLSNVVQMKLSPLKDISPGSAWQVSGALGPHKLWIYPVLMGVKKAMEEEFAKLLILEKDNLKLTTKELDGLKGYAGFFDRDVDIDKLKQAIRGICKGRKKAVGDIIGNASQKNIEEAFPGLASALKLIEEEAK